VHSAATVLAFLQKERGLLQPGYRFRPIVRDEVLVKEDTKSAPASPTAFQVGTASTSTQVQPVISISTSSGATPATSVVPVAAQGSPSPP